MSFFDLTDYMDELLSVQITEITTGYFGDTMLVYSGDSVNFKCEGLGGPNTNLSTIWKQDGKTLPGSDYTIVRKTRDDGFRIISSYVALYDLSQSDNARYTCIITNDSSFLESAITLTIGQDCEFETEQKVT